ncbi:sensor histidine kinase [Olivibacter sp. SDN3]|uniref:sensor histidine kinase n=1 Tax=Olivibacter sp. SDN3 TaxID=2764720 RepID=UPI0016516FD9|nr:7TM diverse intracellular signaling domain-containing protein [Olivibacter sp. SDN3]QNL52058.1 sensor histidine kinase [Olivibacter sp. SDN3]
MIYLFLILMKAVSIQLSRFNKLMLSLVGERIGFLMLNLMLLGSYGLYAQECPSAISLQSASSPLMIDTGISYYIDETKDADFESIRVEHFQRKVNKGVLNFGFTQSKVWLKFCLSNKSLRTDFFLLLQQPSLDSVILYAVDETGEVLIDSLGKYKTFYERFVRAPDYIFPLTLDSGTEREIYIKISSNDQLQIPLFVGSEEAILQKLSNKNLIFGLYAGAVLIMMLYNFFVSVSTRDNSYVFYILYIFSVGLTQALFQGYAFMYFWPNSAFMAGFSSIFVPFFSGLMTIAFIKSFLHTKFYAPKWDLGVNVIVILYFAALLIGIFDIYYGAIVLQVIASLGSIYILFLANYIRKLGYRPAIFFLVAFTVFFVSVILFVLRNFNVIPYNTFTSYILEIGSILEISLLSFALADRINFYRKEKEASQAHALKVSKENERIISEQNVLLETEVAKRTADLEKTNEHLNNAMQNLKQAQAHLVESEKLASLGMLTAGIAHEINNPINFVTSNVGPLKRDVAFLLETIEFFEKTALSSSDIQDKMEKISQYKEELEFDYLKEEIQSLLSGIQEGAVRTAEIVRSLRVFSRVDEDDLKLANLNDCIESTLVVLNSMIKDKIIVEKNYGELPYVECFPGKLNQVFLNLITNSVHAIEQKFSASYGGKLLLHTRADETYTYITIKDNGGGISDDVRDKIFEPFFTTKEIGEGTGLGLAIVLQIISKHHGKITVNSEEGEGCEFLIKIPIAHPNSSHVDDY